MSELDQKTVDRLNDRYNLAVKDCGSRPAYACSGVFVHTIDWSSMLTLAAVQQPGDWRCGLVDRGRSDAFWCPNRKGIGRGAFSFTYLRRDIMPSHGSVVFPILWGPYAGDGAGFILFPVKGPSIKWLCSYVKDSYSYGRQDFGCGQYDGRAEKGGDSGLENHGTCHRWLSRFSAQGYIDTYGINPNAYEQCSFGSGEFSTYLDVQKKVSVESSEWPENEHVLSMWSGMLYSEIPIEAFFYVTGGGAEVNRVFAQSMAQTYSELSGRYVPVVAIDMRVLHNSRTANHPLPFSLG